MANYKTGAQRYNDRMSKIFETARSIEARRLKEGHAPNPNLTSSEEAKKFGWTRKGDRGEFSRVKSKALAKKTGNK